MGTNAMGPFKVNGSQLKHYIAGEPIERKVSYDLPDAPFTKKSSQVGLRTLNKYFLGDNPSFTAFKKKKKKRKKGRHNTKG